MTWVSKRHRNQAWSNGKQATNSNPPGKKAANKRSERQSFLIGKIAVITSTAHIANPKNAKGAPRFSGWVLKFRTNIGAASASITVVTAQMNSGRNNRMQAQYPNQNANRNSHRSNCYN